MESLEGPFPHGGPVQRRGPFDGGGDVLARPGEEARHSVLDEFGHGPYGSRDDGRAAHHGLDQDEPEWFRLFDRVEQDACAAEKSVALLPRYPTDVADAGAVEDGRGVLVEELV